MFLSFVLAVLAAASNAASNVLQRKADREEPAELHLSPRLIWALLHRKVWLAGLGTVTLSFVLMAVALGMGQIAVIQPIIVLELPLTLIGGAWVFGSRLGRREWISTGLLTIGLAGLIAFLFPKAGTSHVSWPTWVVGVGGSVALIAALVFLAERGKDNSSRRAALLGAATGIAFGLTAALMKGMTQHFQHGIVGILTAWQTYAMVCGGFLGMFLMQNALQAGRLIAAQPGITLLDPFTAIIWGVIGFHEKTRGGLFIVLAIISGAVMALGAFTLARSPLLEGDSADREEHDADGPDDGAERRQRTEPEPAAAE